MNLIIETALIDEYPTEVRQLLDILEIEDALVTDDAQFFHFTIDPACGEDEDGMQDIRDTNAGMMEHISELCGCRIEESDTLLFAARMLRENFNVG
jgi:hypothetical protein